MRPTLLIALSIATVAALSAQAPDRPLYRDEQAPVAARVQDLLGRMSLEEKVAQLQSRVATTAFGRRKIPSPLKDGKIDTAYTQQFLAHGLGTFVFLDDFLGTSGSASQGVADRNLLQKWVVENTRLGIPVLFHGEALHGAVVRGGTVFPQAVALASTWDPALLREVYAAAAIEFRSAGNTLVLAPVLDLSRDPRYGRTEEMYSEDPYLTATLGAAAIRGLQGDGNIADQDHALAVAKHFVHGQPENGTNVGPSDFSERTMRQVFLPPFLAAVEANVAGVMPSYNENNGGVPSSANPWLLQQMLREEWHFQGATFSDYFAIDQLASIHHVAADKDAAGVLALHSGVDVELPAPAGYANLADAVRKGKVTTAELDAAVEHVLALKFRARLFEHPYTDPLRVREQLASSEHAQLARRAADEAIILLKNDNQLLPLDAKRIGTLAVIGPNANKMRLGTYSGTPEHFVSVLDAIRARASGRVLYAEGPHISEPDTSPSNNTFFPYQEPDPAEQAKRIAQAVETARLADVVVLVLGGNEAVSRESFGSGGGVLPVSYGDADTLELPGGQEQLLEEIGKLGKPTVAVLLNGKAYSLTGPARYANAIVEGWYLGQETGAAITGVLFGDTNPAGHLPVTIARNVGQLPVFYYKTPASRRGYVFGDNSPLFPFGFGLSYTSFSFRKPVASRATLSPTGTVTVSIEVKNEGNRDGGTVVQCYVHHPVSSVVQPVILLKAFERVYLRAGESRRVEFSIGPRQLAILDLQMKETVETGPVEILIGDSAVNTQAISLVVNAA
jgi:beta-glucosidase